MGVQFGDFIPKRQISLDDLKGKKVAIDGMNALYQFLTSIRLKDGSPLKNKKGEITSAYNGIFYKTIHLLENDITPIWVFDGEPPKLKEKTRKMRRHMKEQAEEKMKEAMKKENLDEVAKFAKRASYLTPKIVDNCKYLLGLMGIPYVNAPSEGEAQASYMAKKGDVWAVVSQDYDSLLYGAPRVVRNLTTTKEMPELINLDDVLEELRISLDDLIDIAILMGTDYNPGGVKGIGFKRAYELVKSGVAKDVLKKEVENYEEIRKIFKEPKITDEYSVNLRLPNKEGIIKFLVDENDFNYERVKKHVDRLYTLIANKTKQKTLDAWFK
ncbi:flap structure-specific endonuclease [Methanocaldococcus vulcanius M7]|uniref:Flap endonuclease 1 n=1 Tax=Methanocaldococcus vulcanius (strain ATCC 700851 / DSM 12094 / M7) TaxID=579137 RepID=C9RG03_METVM|nr:flap endonuclease-1 [Methanocaldococcus vulcanius]ACX72505.1 flap structure-specific endonuclease [Methanocaldococcus vulcanius M7]